MKEATDARKMKAKKEVKAYGKARSKNQSLDIRRLALNTSHVVENGTCSDIFINSINELIRYINKLTSNSTNESVISTTVYLELLRTVKRSLDIKAKTKSQALAKRFFTKYSAKRLNGMNH